MFDVQTIYDRGCWMDRDRTLTVKLKHSEVAKLEHICTVENLHSSGTLIRCIILSFLDEYEQLQQDLADLPDQEAK